MAELSLRTERFRKIWCPNSSPSVLTFLWKVWVALKQKMAFGAVMWQRSTGGKLWAHSQAFMLSLLVGGRSAFGTAGLPVWGQLNTAWDRALKACPVRNEVLCVFVCVYVHVCVCVLVHQYAMPWLNLMNQRCWEGQRFQFPLFSSCSETLSFSKIIFLD